MPATTTSSSSANQGMFNTIYNQLRAQRVALEQTGWVGAGEGLLVLDRNLNNIADSGKELFSNGMVSDAAKGVRSMAWVDANADGVIDASDPVFAALSIWQDANQDGVQDASETHSLASLGITQLDYSNGRFTRNGQLHAMQSPDLEASVEGVQVNAARRWQPPLSANASSMRRVA